MPAAGGAGELGRSKLVEPSLELVAEQSIERGGERSRLDFGQTAAAGKQRCQPLERTLGNRRIVEGRDSRIELSRESRARPQLPRAVIPGKKAEPMLNDAFQQGSLDCRLIGLWVGAAGEADRAQSPAAGRRDRSGRGVERSVVHGLDPIAEEIEDGGFIDRRGGQDTRARSGACDFADRQPLLSAQRGRGI